MTEATDGETAGKLRVSFSDPMSGIVMRISGPPVELKILATHVPHPTMSDLANGLCSLMTCDGSVDVLCDEEPGVHVLRFSKSGSDCTLQIDFHRDYKMLRGGPDATVLHATGPVNEIIAPFWRALRSLQGRSPEAEYSARMSGRGFPAKETEMLGLLLKKSSSKT